MKELSEKQQRILEFIQEFIGDHDYPPSIRQIQEACKISSTSVVDYNLRILEKEGYIRRDREVSRAIELLDELKVLRPPAFWLLFRLEALQLANCRQSAAVNGFI